VGAWLGVLAAVAFAASVLAGGAEARPTSCSRPQQLPSGASLAPLFLQVDETEKLVLHFNDSWHKGVKTVRLHATRGLVAADLAGLNKLNLRTGDASIRKDSDHWISLSPTDGLTASLVPIDRRTLELCAVVNPHKVGSLVPGTYSGTLFVSQGSFGPQLAAVPVEFTFRASRWTGIGIAFGAVVLGLLVKVFSEAESRRRESKVRARQALKTYCCELTFPATLIIAAVGATLVFIQMYYGNAQWGASSGDVAKLFAVCFIAQMSGSETLDIIKRTAGRK
jgi:hypothetical protein